MQHILLLHGAIGSEEQLFPLRDLLKDHFTIHSLNFPGHGGKALPAKMSMDLFANEVLDYVEQKKLNALQIFGYSMGGYVGMYLAHSHPHLVAKLATLGTKYLWTPEIASKEARMLQADVIEQKVPVFAQALSKRHGINEWKNVLSLTASMLLELGSRPLLTEDLLRHIQTKSLLLIGEKDNMVSLEETSAIATCLPNAELKILSDTRHPIEQVNTSILAEQLIRFFA